MGLWQEAITLTLLGMGVVYASLAFLMGVILALNRLFTPVEEPLPAGREERPAGDHLRLVVAAAVAHYLEGGRPAIFTLPVRREGGAQWVRQGRLPAPFERRR
ncbi:MAG: OadG family protein [Nitrospinota bacterium]